MGKDTQTDALPPFLQELKDKGDGFKVPDGYFEKMESSVLARLEAAGNLRQPVSKPQVSAQKLQVSFGPRTAMALAAALALVLAAVWFVRPKWSGLPEGDGRAASAPLTEDDIASYLLENVHEWDASQLTLLHSDGVQLLPDEKTSQTPVQSPSKTELRPEDLDAILDHMTDEELEQIL
jgi:hypothetical protein